VSVPLTVRHGCCSDTLQVLLPKLLNSSPAWVWVEPTPAKERLDDFPGWWSGAAAREVKTWPAALDEARLFWPGASLTLLSDGAGTLWAWHAAAMECPKVLGDGTPQPPLLVEPTPPATVFLRRDWARYGLARLPLADRLRVVEYRNGTQLVCWMLADSTG
jgi:hypothetical protein